MADPFEILANERNSRPNLMSVYNDGKDRRVNEMLLQRKIAAEDREMKRSETIASVYQKLQPPVKGGGQAAPAAGPASAYAPPTAPAAGPAASFDPNMPVGSPLSPATLPSPTVPAEAASVPAARAPITPADQSWLTQNAQALNQLMGVDPEQGMKLYTHLKSLDDSQRSQLIDAQEALTNLGVATGNLPYEQRRAYIAQHVDDLMRAHPGMTPEMVQQFDPTDQNLKVIVNEALGVKGMAEQAYKSATAEETARHNRATEGIASGGLAVRQGALGLARSREGRVASKGSGGGSGGSGSGDVGGLSTADLIHMAGGD